MKKLILIGLLTAFTILGCKKDSNRPQDIDTKPKIVKIIFTNDNVSAQAVYSLNENSHPVIALNGADKTSNTSVQVKSGDKMTVSMFTGHDVTSNFSIKITYNDKQLDYSSTVVDYNGNNRIDLTHAFTEGDFK